MGVTSGCGLVGVSSGCGHCPRSGAGAGKVGRHGIENGCFFLVSFERVAGKGCLEGLAHHLTQLIGLWQERGERREEREGEGERETCVGREVKK